MCNEDKQIWKCNFSREETWTDDNNLFDTVDEAMTYGKKQILIRREEDKEEYKSFQVGRLVYYMPEVKVDAYEVIRNILGYAERTYGDSTEFFLDGLADEDLEKLEGMLNETANKWLNGLDETNKLVRAVDIQEIFVP